MEDLIQAHIETLYAVDAEGDLTVNNAPYDGGRSQAPMLHLAWDDSHFAVRFRSDVAGPDREQCLEALQEQWPFPGEELPPAWDRIGNILGASGRGGSGPAYVVNGIDLASGDAVLIDRSNSEVLESHFGQWIEDLDVCQPFTAVLLDGVAVSVCHTVRRSRHGIEAGIDTAEGFRRRGYGRDAVAAWSALAEGEGGLGFYSTSWLNRASVGLANSLGLRQFAVECSIS